MERIFGAFHGHKGTTLISFEFFGKLYKESGITLD